MTSKVYNKQIGGTHYRQIKIQPSRFVIENELLFPEGNVIKYICRHPYKGGKEDLEKAKHFIDMIIERDYSVVPMTEEEEYRNAGITKEEAERNHGPQESWATGYNKWKTKKERCPHN